MWTVYHSVEPDGLEHFIGFHPAPSEICPVGRNIATVLKEPYHQIGNSVKQEMEKITLQHLLGQYHDLETSGFSD